MVRPSRTSGPARRGVRRSASENRLAGIQYLGLAGVSRSCLHGIMQLIQFGLPIRKAALLTADHDHAFLLTVDDGDQIAIKAGFTSGYRGEGPTALADALELLLFHGAEIEEILVDSFLIERLNLSTLTLADISHIEITKPVRPMRLHEYIWAIHGVENEERNEWRKFPVIIPLALVNTQIRDLAITFLQSPDKSLLDGFRRLEDRIRKLTNSSESGAKLFSQAFLNADSNLFWPQLKDVGEQTGRGQLFVSTYMAFRNPRAHRELRHDYAAMAQEFLLLNTLFGLAESAVPRTKQARTPEEFPEDVIERTLTTMARSRARR